MQIAINISDSVYKDLQLGIGVGVVLKLEDIVVLPKGRGRWNFTKHYGRDYYVCSVCGMERMDDHSRGWNYCPNCGAIMKIEADGDAK